MAVKETLPCKYVSIDGCGRERMTNSDVCLIHDMVLRAESMTGASASYTPDELLSNIGTTFAAEYPDNRKKAWRNVMFSLVSNIAPLSTASRDRIECVRAIITMAREIDDKMGADENNSSGTGEPLDKVAKGWVQD